MRRYINYQLKELLEYCSNMEKYEHKMYVEYLEDGDEREAIFHHGEAEAYHDIVNKIVKMLED